MSRKLVALILFVCIFLVGNFLFLSTLKLCGVIAVDWLVPVIPLFILDAVGMLGVPVIIFHDQLRGW